MYLIDNFDNFAKKSLSNFKSEKTNLMINQLSKKVEEENEDNSDEEKKIESFKNLENYLNKDPFKPEPKNESHLNFKLINNCV